MINPKLSEPPRNLTHEAGTTPVDLHRIPDATVGWAHRRLGSCPCWPVRSPASGHHRARFRSGTMMHESVLRPNARASIRPGIATGRSGGLRPDAIVYRGGAERESGVLVAPVCVHDQQGRDHVAGSGGSGPPGACFFAATLALGVQAEKVHAVGVACLGGSRNCLDRRRGDETRSVTFKECQVVICVGAPRTAGLAE